MFFYRICGLSVASELALPGLSEILADAAPDVTIQRGPVPDHLPQAAANGPTWQIAKERLLLSIPSVARFLLSDGLCITFCPISEAALADIPIFILGTVFGVLLHQRGNVVLHASAVNVNGRAVLFCGPSGAGKSTLAAALSQRGYPLMTDDVCSVRAASAPIVYPDGRQLKLWDQAIENLNIKQNRGPTVRPSLQKYYVEPPSAHSAPLPLGAVYCLRETRPPFTTGIEAPNIVDAAMLIRRNAYRPLLVRRMNQKESYFHAASSIASYAGIFFLTRPMEFAAMPDVVSQLEGHWRECQLLEKVG